MTYYLRAGNSFKPTDENELNLYEILPAGNYIIQETPQGELYLEQVEPFRINGKIYGNATRHSDRIITTFNQRSASTGVMLTGEKGSGKTMLAKMLSIKLAEQGVPTIIINAAWTGDKFNKLIQDISQPCVIIFDEFEKVYDKDDQPAVLTLLDGVFPSKKLFILTCNDKWRVDSHMRNRPGRIYYMIDFQGLEASFIEEYCTDNLKALEHIPAIKSIATLFAEFNFDMLKAMVEEMNRYGETPHEVIKLLNVNPMVDDSGKYTVSVIIDGEPASNIYPNSWNGNPLSKQVIDVTRYYEEDGESEEEDFRVSFKDLKKVDPVEEAMIFQIEDEGRQVAVVFTKIKLQGINYSSF